MPITAGMVSAASGLKNPAGAVALGYRVNLCANPTFEVDSANWTALGASVVVAQSSEQAYSGSSSLKVTLTTVSSIGATYGSTNRVPITAGNTYAVSAYIKTGASNEVGSYRLRVRAYSALTGGTIISTISGLSTELQPDSEWTRVSATVSLSDPGIQAVIFWVESTTTATNTGDVLYVDNVMIEKSTTVNNYFDGNSSGAFWGGAENASISGITPY